MIKVLVVGQEHESEQIKNSLAGLGYTDLEITVQPDTGEHDIVVGPKCIRVFPETADFIKPFVEKVKKEKKAAEPKTPKKKKVEEPIVAVDMVTTPATGEALKELIVEGA